MNDEYMRKMGTAIRKTREVLSIVDASPALALFMTDGVRRATAADTGAPLSDTTALVGIHIVRVEIGRDPLRAKIYDVSPEQVQRSIEFIRKSGYKTRLGDLS